MAVANVDALVAIPVYNGVRVTLECLRSLSDAGQRMSNILVVDNGSTDGTAERIRRDFPTVSLHSQANLGFAAAANVGLRASVDRNFKYTWLLNSDTVVRRETLATLLAFMEAPGNATMGACSPLIYRARQPDALDFAGAWVDLTDWTSGHHSGPGEAPARGAARRPFLTGCALLIRNDAAMQVGLFDERFFMYWEDVDFSLRMLEAGYALGVVRSASVLHHVFGSSSQDGSLRHYYDVRNRFLMCQKHSAESPGVKREMLRWAIGCLSAARPGRIDNVPLAQVKGFVDGLAGRFGRRPHRPPAKWAPVVLPVVWLIAAVCRVIPSKSRAIWHAIPGWRRRSPRLLPPLVAPRR